MKKARHGSFTIEGCRKTAMAQRISNTPTPKLSSVHDQGLLDPKGKGTQAIRSKKAQNTTLESFPSVCANEFNPLLLFQNLQL
jgi:hypothetical protein